MTGHVLHIGSGRAYKAGAVNVDLVAETNPDVVHDLNLSPWPFRDSTFTEILAYDVIEHLGDLVRIAEEMHRVCKRGATIRITVPHYSCDNAYTDPTHKHLFGWRSFDYFSEDHAHNFYSTARFRVTKRQMMFRPGILNKLVHRFANRYPERYEERWAWIAPAWFLYFELEVKK
jgi:SAM-dependent methyltransferase